jgi:hypothetical protein
MYYILSKYKYKDHKKKSKIILVCSEADFLLGTVGSCLERQNLGAENSVVFY